MTDKEVARRLRELMDARDAAIDRAKEAEAQVAELEGLLRFVDETWAAQGVYPAWIRDYICGYLVREKGERVMISHEALAEILAPYGPVRWGRRPMCTFRWALRRYVAAHDNQVIACETWSPQPLDPYDECSDCGSWRYAHKKHNESLPKSLRCSRFVRKKENK